MNDVIFFRLSGNAHDRRKRYREILKKYLYPAFLVKRSAVTVSKTLDGKRVSCEEGNKPQTVITIQKQRSK